MRFLKSKEQIVQERLGSVNESVFKMGDVFKVKTTVDIPKSLVNAFVSKAKKEHGIDARETWSDIDLAEMFVTYINANFINVESLPVDKILGDANKTNGEVSTDVQPQENAQPVQPVQIQPEATAQPVQTQPGQPTAEIQDENAQ